MSFIGLLWDSVSNNMGDQAIGLLLQRALAAHNIPSRVIDPFHPTSEDICGLIIGGGEIIRKPGDPFYDAFRVPGAHILNTVGVLDGHETEYLKSYRMVTVRSHADRERLQQGEVAPCLTLLYGKYLPVSDPSIQIPHNAVGIHLNWGLHNKIEDLIDWILSEKIGPIVWIPITHYMADEALLNVIGQHLPDSIVLPPMPPDETFRVIGKLKLLVSASLHGTFFAYTQGVPVIAHAKVQKLAAFLNERNLGEMLFDEDNLIDKITTSLASPPDMTACIERDQQRCDEILSQIVATAKSMLDEPRLASIQFAHTRKDLYDQQMRATHEIGTIVAALVSYRLTLAQKMKNEVQLLNTLEEQSLAIDLLKSQLGELTTSLEYRLGRRLFSPIRSLLNNLRGKDTHKVK